MTEERPRLGPHDVGGLELGLIDLKDHPTEDWHALAMALYTAAMAGPEPLFNAHEYRRTMEAMPPEAHEEMEYHTRAVETMSLLLIEKGFIDPVRLSERMARDAAG